MVSRLLLNNRVDGQHRPVCHQCVVMGQKLSQKDKELDEKDASVKLYKQFFEDCGKKLVYENIRLHRENENLNIMNEDLVNQMDIFKADRERLHNQINGLEEERSEVQVELCITKERYTAKLAIYSEEVNSLQTIRRELEGKMYNEIKHRREVEEHMEKLNIQLNTANQCIKQLEDCENQVKVLESKNEEMTKALRATKATVRRLQRFKQESVLKPKASSSRLQQPQCDEKINVEPDEKHDPTESPDNASFFLVKPLSYEEKMQKLNKARVMKKKKRSTNRHKSNKRKDTKQGSQATANTKTNGLISTPAPVKLVDQQETMEIASPIDRDIPGMSVIEAQPKDVAIDTPVLWMDIKENVNLIPIHTPSKLTRKRRSSEIYIPHKAVSKRPCSFKIQTKQFYDLQPRFLSRFYKLYIQMKYKDKYSTEKKRNQELNLLNTAQEKEISRLKKLFGEAIMRSPPRLIDIHELLLKRLPADRSYAPGFSHLLCVTVRFTGEDPIDLIAIFKEWKKRTDDSCIDTIPWNWRALFDLLRQQFHCPIISREMSIQSWVDNIESDLTEKGLTALAVPRCHRCEEEYYVQYDGGGRYTEAVECSQAMSDTFVPTVTPTMTDEI